ncbi:hypothetical protein [Sorangium sp. So ce542]|uniref:hypothetical protein n=1 Tax=Sorangium sp. So ce542 TaxID=3133316 RepID=UPI003F5EFFA9
MSLPGTIEERLGLIRVARRPLLLALDVAALEDAGVLCSPATLAPLRSLSFLTACRALPACSSADPAGAAACWIGLIFNLFGVLCGRGRLPEAVGHDEQHSGYSQQNTHEADAYKLGRATMGDEGGCPRNTDYDA